MFATTAVAQAVRNNVSLLPETCRKTTGGMALKTNGSMLNYKCFLKLAFYTVILGDRVSFDIQCNVHVRQSVWNNNIITIILHLDILIVIR